MFRKHETFNTCPYLLIYHMDYHFDLFLFLAEYYVKEETRSSKTGHRFRALSREVCGEIFDIPEDNKVIFAYERRNGKETTIGGLCFHPALRTITEPTEDFDSNYFHEITFMFVKGDFQGIHIGTKLFERSIKLMRERGNRPVRVQSAEKAVGFFEKMGFTMKSNAQIETMCGVGLFKVIYNMERPLSMDSDRFRFRRR